MTTLVNNTKTYAAVAATRRAPHIQDQKATGRPKGITATGCSTTGVGAIKPTTDQSYQGTTESSMGETQAHKKMQLQDKAKAMLRKALYKIFDVKEMIVTEVKDPIKVNALCLSGRNHGYSLASQTNHKFYKKVTWPQDNGHKYAPPPDKLRRSQECFHCHKKGHFTHNCQSKHPVDHDRQEVATTQSCPDMGTLPIDQLAKRIQENKRANSFSALNEENLDQINPPALLDAKKIKEITKVPEHMFRQQKTKAVQEFIADNAHKFDKATRARIINLCKPKPKSIAK